MDKQFRERLEFLESLYNVLVAITQPSKLKRILTEYELADYKSLLKYGIDDSSAMDEFRRTISISLETTQNFRRDTNAN